MKIEKTIDRDSKEKLYVQMYSIFLQKIENGEWQSGTKIPTENQLCNLYNVSKVTVREAIQELVREGFLKRQQGKGTFVTYSIPHSGLLMRVRLTDNIYGEGVKIEKEVIEKSIRKSLDEFKDFFGDEELHYVLLRKKVGGNLFSEEYFVPIYVLPDLEKGDIEKKSIIELIEERGAKKVFKIIQTIELLKVSKLHARILKAKEGSIALYLNKYMLSSDGKTIGLIKHVSKENNKLSMEFERIK